MSEKTLNVALLAHVDAGKTSITEQLLYLSGSIRQAGKVDDGTSITDFMEVERKRGISVKTACALLNWQEREICLVDTPGHVDFVGEVERSLGVLDGAVLVVSAVEGVQSHTQLIWKSLRKLNIPTLIFINKIDRIGADPQRVMRQIKEELSPMAVLIQDYEGLETEECAISSPLLDEKMISDSMKEELILAFAQEDPDLEERYLMEEEITLSELREPFILSCQSGTSFPVLLGSAKTGCGIAELMDGIVHLLPDSKRLEIPELSGIVFKIEHDPDMGKAAYIRLFGGRLQNRELVRIGEKEEKITQIRRFSGQRYVDSGVLNAGEIGTIYGLGSVQCGDVIGKAPENRECVMAVPLLMVKAEAENEEKLSALLSALQELSEEDPLLDLEWSPSTREMYVKITGSIQLEILEEVVKERYGLKVAFSEPTILYKETPMQAGVGYESYTMPKPCWAQVELKMEPLPRGSGLQFQSVLKEKQIPYRYQHHVETSVFMTRKQGIRGWEVTDALITLCGGSHHNIHTHPLDFFVATPVAFLRALTNCGSQLLEPYVRVHLAAKEEFLGKVLGQILDMRGEFESPKIVEGEFMLEAVLPVATSLDYPITFRSMTSGKGIYSSQFDGYREAPPEVQATLPRRGVDPLDIDKWILYCRNALV